MPTRFAQFVVALVLPVAGLAQGVPVSDPALTARDILETRARAADLTRQAEKRTLRETLSAIKADQLATLEKIFEAQTSFGAQDVSGLISDLEAGHGAPDRAAEVVYGARDVDPNPGAAGLFGDATESIEALIIRGARETATLAGVRRAGLSAVQWRALLQALIWQESRFSIGARSTAGAFGLTQIMPDTARDLGIHPDYYDSPYLQIVGGARYLAAQLRTFDGNIVNALAAYNAGPGRVFEYGGVPPFKETQHYVRVVPARYNHYLSRIGGIEARGTIDTARLATVHLSLTGHRAALYGDAETAAITAAAHRIADIVVRIGRTADVQESLALNTYARAELARLMAARLRLKAARTAPHGAAELAAATARRADADFMDFTLQDFE